MTEFAFSGIGWNPHYGTPLNPFDPRGRADSRRLVVGRRGFGRRRHVRSRDRHRHRRLGPHPGGAVRHQSASSRRRAGCRPRAACRCPSASIRSGRWPNSVACCALVDAVLAGEAPSIPAAPPVGGMRLLAQQSYVLEDMDRPVARAYERALGRLTDAGARITFLSVELLNQLARDQCPWRPRRRRSLALASRPAGRQGRGLRPAGARAHRARRTHGGGGLYRGAAPARAVPGRPSRRSSSPMTRSSCRPRRSSPRPWPRSRRPRFRPHQHADVSATRRSANFFDGCALTVALPGTRHGAGRADGDVRADGRPAHSGNRPRDRGRSRPLSCTPNGGKRHSFTLKSLLHQHFHMSAIRLC